MVTLGDGDVCINTYNITVTGLSTVQYTYGQFSLSVKPLVPFSLYMDTTVTLKLLLLMKPAQSAGFLQIKKIPYQAPPTQLGPRKSTF